MNKVLAKLSGGDLRSEGQAAEVAGEIIDHPDLLVDLAQGLRSDDKLIRARTCMAIEVVSRDHPALLETIVPQLVELASRETVPQARWHLAEVFGKVALSGEDPERVVPILLGHLTDRSKIVRCCAVQTLGVLGARSSRKGEIIEGISTLTGVTKSLDKAVANAMRALGVERR